MSTNEGKLGDFRKLADPTKILFWLNDELIGNIFSPCSFKNLLPESSLQQK